MTNNERMNPDITASEMCEIRMRCLDMAIQTNNCGCPVELAREFANFVLGTSAAEIVNAARDLAGKVKD